MKKLMIALTSLLFMSAAHAELTTAQKAEALKFIHARVHLTTAHMAFAETMDNLTSLGPTIESRLPYTLLMDNLAYSGFFCGRAFFRLHGVPDRKLSGDPPSINRPPRHEEVVLAHDEADKCSGALAEAINALGNLTHTKAAEARVAAEAAKAQVDSFDWALAWDTSDPRPVDNALTPWDERGTIVGPHGHLDMSRATLSRADHYLYQTFFVVPHFIEHVPAWNPDANHRVSELWRALGITSGRAVHAYALEMQTPLPEDDVIIAGDTAASNGIRPPSFFIPILEGEYILGRIKGSTPKTASGRSIKNGVVDLFQAIPNHFSEILAFNMLTNSGPDIADWFNKEATGGATKYTYGKDFWTMFSDMWTDFDRWHIAVSPFYDAATPPPPTVPSSGDVVCGTGTELDAVTNSCVSTVICPPFVDEQLRIDSVVSDAVTGTITFSCRP